MGQLDGKVAIITGGGSTLGQGGAEARLFAEQGAAGVVLIDLPGSQGAAIAAEIGERALYIEHDVRDDAAWPAVIAQVLERFGTIDVLVNNAGVWFDEPLVDTTPADYRAVVETNQVGVFLGTYFVAPVMIAAGKGSIINTCSSAGMIGRGQPHAYAASKWAVRGMTIAAAAELASKGVRVNAVSPGVVDTPMIAGGAPEVERLKHFVPQGRVAQPQEIATLVAFLASDASDYINGAVIPIDGAITA